MKTVVIVVALLASNAALAASDQRIYCTSGGEERIVDLAYHDVHAVPCEVRYTKAGGMQVLWRAENETGYCEQKFDMFVQKLQSGGWKCD